MVYYVSGGHQTACGNSLCWLSYLNFNFENGIFSSNVVIVSALSFSLYLQVTKCLEEC